MMAVPTASARRVLSAALSRRGGGGGGSALRSSSSSHPSLHSARVGAAASSPPGEDDVGLLLLRRRTSRPVPPPPSLGSPPAPRKPSSARSYLTRPPPKSQQRQSRWIHSRRATRAAPDVLAGEEVKDARSSLRAPSSTANDLVRAELSAMHGSDDAYESLLESLRAASERLEEAAAAATRLSDDCAAGGDGGGEEREAVEAEMIDALTDAGKAHWNVGLLEEARNLYEDALRRTIELHSRSDSDRGGEGSDGDGGGGSEEDMPDHPAVASLLHLLGNVHARSGDPREATKWYESSLAMKKRLYGNRTYHPEIGRTLNGLALLRLASDGVVGGGEEEWEIALRLLEEAERNYTFYKYDRDKLAPERRAGQGARAGPGGSEEEGEHDAAGDYADHPDVALINENIADIYRRNAEYDVALGRYAEALRIREMWLPGKPSTEGGASPAAYDGKAVGLVLAAADCLAALDRHDEAAARYEDALEEHLKMVREKRAARKGGVAEKEEGDGGSGGGSWLSSPTDRSDSAEDREESAGADTALEAVLRHNLGLMHSRQSRFDLALEQFKRARDIKRALAGESHPEVANTLNAMGATYGSMGEQSSALVHFREALYVYRMHAEGDEDDDPDVVNAKRNIALIEGSRMKDERGGDPLR